MKKKLLFLAMTIIACVALFTSCSKEDEPENISVANTSWRADDGTTFKFYADGTCQLGHGMNEYHQIGNEVNIVGCLVWYNKSFYYTRYAYVKGDYLDVEMRPDIKSNFDIVRFYKVK